MKAKPLDYDPLSDSLLVIVPEREYRYSVMLDDVILDFGKLGKNAENNEEKLDIVGFEILNASEKFRVKKHMLRNIKKLKAKIEISKSSVKIKVEIYAFTRNREKFQSNVLEMSNEGIPSMVASISV